jgi:hypothetical protein
MAYLNFLRERVHAPVPRLLALFDPMQEWVSRQIVDEIRDEWPGCSVKMIKPGEESKADMIVVPFEGKSPTEIAVAFHNLSSEWVMLYGLDRRRIWILPLKEAIALVRKARQLRKVRGLLSRLRIVRPIKWAIQFWKRFMCP